MSTNPEKLNESIIKMMEDDWHVVTDNRISQSLQGILRRDAWMMSFSTGQGIPMSLNLTDSNKQLLRL